MGNGGSSRANAGRRRTGTAATRRPPSATVATKASDRAARIAAEAQEAKQAWAATLATARDPARYRTEFARAAGRTAPNRLAGVADERQRAAILERARAWSARPLLGGVLVRPRDWTVGPVAAAIGARVRALAARTFGHERGQFIGPGGRPLAPEERSTFFYQPKAGREPAWYGEMLEHPDATLARVDAAVRAGDAVHFLHTHPADSLSAPDVRSMFVGRQAGVHAVGPGPDGRPWLFSAYLGPRFARMRSESTRVTAFAKLKFMTRFNRLYAAAQARNAREIAAGRMTAAEADASTNHEVMRRLARVYGPKVLTYEAGPLPAA